jgi:hypothetical protein
MLVYCKAPHGLPLSQRPAEALVIRYYLVGYLLRIYYWLYTAISVGSPCTTGIIYIHVAALYLLSLPYITQVQLPVLFLWLHFF